MRPTLRAKPFFLSNASDKAVRAGYVKHLNPLVPIQVRLRFDSDYL